MMENIKIKVMKELSIEEKAKRYDEAIGIARKQFEYPAMSSCYGLLEELFPELKDSEDEKIRKELLAFFKNFSKNGTWKHIQDVEKWLAWLEKQGETFTKKDVDDAYLKGICDAKHELEKQGEQKPTSDIRYEVKVGDSLSVVSGKPFDYEHATITQKDFASVGETATIELSSPIDCGDWIVSDDKDVHEDYRVCKITKIGDGRYYIEGGDFLSESSLAQYEYRLWTIQDAKPGDVLVASDGSIIIFAGVVDWGCKHYVALTTDGAVKFNEGLEHYWETSKAVHPATKEQRDQLKKAMADAGYTFDFEKKELKKIEQKSDIIFDSSKLKPDANPYWTKAPGYQLENGKKQEWSDEDEENLNWFEKFFRAESVIAEGKDIPQDRYLWLKSLKDRVQPKQEWSAFDERNLQGIIDEIEANKNQAPGYDQPTYDNFLNWLESLRPQNRWKPSDEQMYWLKKAIDSLDTISVRPSRQNLESLYNDLKKLSEE